MRFRLVVPAAALIAAACSTTTQGSPTSAQTTSSPSTAVASFDACTALDDSTVQAFRGLPETQQPYTAGGADGETGCSWDSADRAPDGGRTALYSIDIASTPRTVDEYLSNPTFTSTESTVGGRRSVNFVASEGDNACNLAVEIPGGSAVVVISPGFASVTRDQACAEATAAAEAIAPSLPT